MEKIFIDLALYLGIMALITVVVDWLKVLKVIKKPGQGKEIAGIIQSALTIVFAIVGFFFPEWLNSTLPVIDNICGMIAELGLGLLALLPVGIRLGQMFHDVFGGLPVLGFLSKSVD